MSNPWDKIAPVTETRRIEAFVEKQIIAFDLDEDEIAKMLKEAIIARMSDSEKERWSDVEVRMRVRYGENITAEVELIGDPR